MGLFLLRVNFDNFTDDFISQNWIAVFALPALQSAEAKVAKILYYTGLFLFFSPPQLSNSSPLW